MTSDESLNQVRGKVVESIQHRCVKREIQHRHQPRGRRHVHCTTVASRTLALAYEALSAHGLAPFSESLRDYTLLTLV